MVNASASLTPAAPHEAGPCNGARSNNIPRHLPASMRMGPAIGKKLGRGCIGKLDRLLRCCPKKQPRPSKVGENRPKIEQIV
jgi:hypothetical protein